jgi:response regulator of citrate/malate metabolism
MDQMSNVHAFNPEMPLTNLLLLLAGEDLDAQLLATEIIGQIDPRWTIWTAASGWQVMNILQKPPGGLSPRFLLIDNHLRDMNANQLLGNLSRHVQYDKIFKFALTEEKDLHKAQFFLTQNLWLFRKPVKPSEFKLILTQILSIVRGVNVIANH